MRSSELHISDYKLRSARAPRRFPLSRSAISKTTFAEIAERFAPELQSEESDESGLPVPTAGSAPPAEMRRPGLPLKAVIAAVIGGALVPTTILFALLWQGTMKYKQRWRWWSERGKHAQLGRSQPRQKSRSPRQRGSRSRPGSKSIFPSPSMRQRNSPLVAWSPSAPCLMAPPSQKAVPMAPPDGACAPTRSASCGSDYPTRKAGHSTCASNCLLRTELYWPNPKRD